MKVKQTPNRAPISESVSAVELIMGRKTLKSIATVNTMIRLDGVGIHLQAPEKNPYKIAKIIVPATSLMTRVQNMRRDVPKTQGMVTLKAPSL